MVSRVILFFCAAAAWIVTLSEHVTAFTAPSTLTMRTSTALHAATDRRAFMSTMFVSTVVASSPALADEASVDDLAMPTAQEQKNEVCSNLFFQF